MEFLFTLVLLAAIIFAVMAVSRSPRADGDQRRPLTEAPSQAPGSTRNVRSAAVQKTVGTDRVGGSRRNPAARWIGPEDDATVAGRTLHGMIYLGTEPHRDTWHGGVAIDPHLSVAKIGGFYAGEGMPYWPSYRKIQPRERATYLDWLAAGRDDPRIGTGYVFLFFYGIERRYFVDNPEPTAATLVAVKRDFVPLLIGVAAGFSGDLGAHRFQRGIAVAGSVRSPDGIPVRGATVSIVPRSPSINMPPHVAPTWTTATDGSFSASGFLPGAHDVLVDAQGHVPSRRIRMQVDDSRANELHVTLYRGYAISGRVVGKFGAPVAMADVSATGHGVQLNVRTDAQGRFELSPIPEVSVTLTAEHATGSATPLRMDSAATDVVMALRGGIAVRGAIYGTNGESVDQFTIESAVGSTVLSSHTFRDTTSFDIRIDGNAQAIWISAPGFASWSKPVDLRSRDSESLDIGNVVLERADRALRGRTIDRATGAGVAGAHVSYPTHRIPTASRDAADHRAKTDATGRFEIRGLPSFRPIRLVATAPGYARASVHAAPGEQPVTIELDAGGSISGVLVAPDDTPVSGTVRLVESDRDRTRPWDRDLLFGLSVDAGEDGGFAFDGLPPRRFRLKGQSGDGLVGERTVSLRDGALTDIRLEVQRLGRVFGSVSGLDPGQRVYLRVADLNRRGVSHGTGDFSNGPYELHGIPGPGEFAIVASTPGRRVVKQFEISGLDARVDLALDAGYRLAGRITLRGRPKADVEVAATSAAGALATTGWGRSDGLGRYEVLGLDAGPYVLAAYGQEFEVDVSGDTVYDVDLADSSLSGTVRSPYPLGDVTVRADSLSSDDVYRTQLDGRGGYRFDSIVPGDYRIGVRTPYFEPATRVVRVDGALQDVDFDLQPAAATDLHAVDAASGSRVSSAVVTVTARGGVLGSFAFDVPVDPQGVLKVPTTLAGRELTLSAPGYQSTVVPAWDGQSLVVQFVPLASR